METTNLTTITITKSELKKLKLVALLIDKKPSEILAHIIDFIDPIMEAFPIEDEGEE